MCKLGVISQDWLKTEVKLLLSANRKSHMPRRLAQQQMTSSDLECLKSTSSASRAISAIIAELLVLVSYNMALVDTAIVTCGLALPHSGKHSEPGKLV